MTFISVLRLVSVWFPGRLVPVLTQLTGILGPARPGRRGVPAGARCWRHLLDDDLRRRGRGRGARRRARRRRAAGRPAGHALRRPADAGRRSARDLARQLARAGHPDRPVHPPRHPVLRHRVRPALGLPVPHRRRGPAAPAPPPRCSRCWSLVGMAVGPLLGQLSRALAAAPQLARARHPRRDRRGRGPSCSCGRAGPRCRCSCCSWSCWRSNGPGSMIGFDYARTENPAPGSAAPAASSTSAASWPRSVLMLCIGLVLLDALTPGSSTDYSLGAFRAAFACSTLLWAIGVVGVLRHRRGSGPGWPPTASSSPRCSSPCGPRWAGGSAYDRPPGSWPSVPGSGPRRRKRSTAEVGGDQPGPRVGGDEQAVRVARVHARISSRSARSSSSQTSRRGRPARARGRRRTSTSCR